MKKINTGNDESGLRFERKQKILTVLHFWNLVFKSIKIGSKQRSTSKHSSDSITCSTQSTLNIGATVKDETPCDKHNVSTSDFKNVCEGSVLSEEIFNTESESRYEEQSQVYQIHRRQRRRNSCTRWNLDDESIAKFCQQADRLRVAED